jgi:hypothetical protein
MRTMIGLTAIRAGVASVGLPWLVIAFSAAQLADLVTALAVAKELNPIAAAVAAEAMIGVALKTSLIALVVATADICGRTRPGLARFVLVVGTVAGLISALSNTRLTPFGFLAG